MEAWWWWWLFPRRRVGLREGPAAVLHPGRRVSDRWSGVRFNGESAKRMERWSDGVTKGAEGAFMGHGVLYPRERNRLVGFGSLLPA